MAELFQKAKSTINEHIKNIYADGVLSEATTLRKFGNSENAENIIFIKCCLQVAYYHCPISFCFIPMGLILLALVPAPPQGRGRGCSRCSLRPPPHQRCRAHGERHPPGAGARHRGIQERISPRHPNRHLQERPLRPPRHAQQAREGDRAAPVRGEVKSRQMEAEITDRTNRLAKKT